MRYGSSTKRFTKDSARDEKPHGNRQTAHCQARDAAPKDITMPMSRKCRSGSDMRILLPLAFTKSH
jgi:hypothetical protein